MILTFLLVLRPTMLILLDILRKYITFFRFSLIVLEYVSCKLRGDMTGTVHRSVGYHGGEMLNPAIHPCEWMVKMEKIMRWWTLRQLRSKDDFSREKAIGRLTEKALYEIGPPAVAPLVATLKNYRVNANPYLRRKAAIVLGRIGDAQAAEAVMDVIRDQDVLVRRAAVEALRKIGRKEVVAPLAFALEDSDVLVRRAAVEALWMIGGSEVEELLLMALGDTDSKVSRDARIALSEIAPARIDTDLALEWASAS